MKMAEGAKLQMCYLLHHLCDVQLRHRVESIVAFSFDFVGDLQTVIVLIAFISRFRLKSLSSKIPLLCDSLGSIEEIQ